jgi:hypothetical protein
VVADEETAVADGAMELLADDTRPNAASLSTRMLTSAPEVSLYPLNSPTIQPATQEECPPLP